MLQPYAWGFFCGLVALEIVSLWEWWRISPNRCGCRVGAAVVTFGFICWGLMYMTMGQEGVLGELGVAVINDTLVIVGGA